MSLIDLSYAGAGFALLLFSLRHLISSLDREIMRYLSTWLHKMTQSSFRAILAGTIATVIVQASSVTIIASMGFLSRGLLTLDKAILIMLGAALGSTLKGWYSTQIPWVVGPIFLVVGSLGFVAGKSQRRRDLFEAMAAIGMTFLGLKLIETGIEPLARTQVFRNLIEVSLDKGFFSVLKTVAFGAILSTILQSSSSVLFMVISFSMRGFISIPGALSLILGANLGTTTTPWLASIGQENGEVKKLALSYCIIKVFAVALVLTYFRTHMVLLEDGAWLFGLEKRPDILIVTFHSWFNLMNALTWWFFLPVLLRISAWLVPAKEANLGTQPFTLRIQKLLSSLPEKALSESMNKLQLVIRDLHWVSESIFHIVEQRGNREHYSKLLEQSIQKCEKSIQVLDTVRDVAWSYLRTSEHTRDSRKKVLSLVLLIADLKSIEAILSSCINTFSFEDFASVSESAASVVRFRVLREQLNESWEKIYSLERYLDFAQHLNPDLYGRREIDLRLLEVNIRLAAVHKLIEHNSASGGPIETESSSNHSSTPNKVLNQKA